MPAFVKSKKDEERWRECKASVSKTVGRSPDSFTSRDWARVNGCFHRRKSKAGGRRMSESPVVRGR